MSRLTRRLARLRAAASVAPTPDETADAAEAAAAASGAELPPGGATERALTSEAEPETPALPAARGPGHRGSADVEALRGAIRRILERHAAREAARSVPPRPAGPGPHASAARPGSEPEPAEPVVEFEASGPSPRFGRGCEPTSGAGGGDAAPGGAPEPLPGELTATDFGSVRRLVTYHEPHHAHGRVAVRGARSVDAAALAALAGQPELGAVDVRRALFVDTETTGLAGGTGTVPFLVGLGWFEDESFVVEQLLLEQLGEEPPLMRWVRDRLASASCLVTFNGKAYDAPLLATRAVLSRVGDWPQPPHVDLLHLARRSYRRRLPTFRLVELERSVLGFVREHDIDGAEVPGAYWSFLRTSRPSFLAPILEHNLHDIVALAALLAELVGGYAKVDAAHEPADQVCRALWALRTNDHGRVEAFAAAVEAGGAPPGEALAAYMAAAVSARRRKDVAAERRWLDRALTGVSTPEEEREVRLERAKHFEHRARAPALALSEAEALLRVDASEAALHRRARLVQRARRAEASARAAAGSKAAGPAVSRSA